MARIAIRADASVQIGTGHIRRCIELAHAFAAAGAEICFVSRDLDVDGRGIVEAGGFGFSALPAPTAPFVPRDGLPHHAPWAVVPWELDAEQTAAALSEWAPEVIVVDHYAFDRRWHARVRQRFDVPFVAIDDLGDRPLDVALIVDHNYSEDHVAKHQCSASFGPRILGGPAFALLSGAYRRRADFMVRDTVTSVGIFMGGSDLVNSSEIAWRAVREALGQEVAIELVVTHANPHRADLERVVRDDARTKLTLDLPDLVDFFSAHDLQVGAGGGATWERCCIGAPTVAIAFADNHSPVLRPLDAMGVLSFSRGGEGNVGILAADIAALAGDVGRRRQMSGKERALVDGWGTKRVEEAVSALLS